MSAETGLNAIRDKLLSKSDKTVFVIYRGYNYDINNLEGLHLKMMIDSSTLEQMKYSYIEVEDINDEQIKSIDITKAVPIGDIGFVRKFIERYLGLEYPSPIEIPKVMRNESYVGREYKIVDKEELKKGNEPFSFFKYCSKPKVQSFISCLDTEKADKILDGLWVVSEYVEIVSEYRVICLNDAIEGVQWYNGGVEIFPDIAVVKQILKDYRTKVSKISNAITIDVAVTKDGRTILLEIHTFSSCGTYGYIDRNLVNLYKEGYEYIKNGGIDLINGE